MNLKEAVAAAVEIMVAHPHLEEWELVEKFAERTGDSELAERLIEFVPLAFGRIITDALGVKSVTYYIRLLEDGEPSPHIPFSAEPVWKPALDYAYKAIGTLNREQFALVSMRSAELDAVNKARANGSDPANLVGSPIVFLHPAPIPVLKKWWQFWK